jgi:hypothetical protein
MLGQHIEFSCKRILSVFDLGKSIRDGNAVDMDNWAKHMDDFVEKRLASAIRKFGMIHNISAEKVSLLDKAREARNYIAHEGALLWFGVRSEELEMPVRISKLRQLAGDLAAAHNLVSGWGYSIEEKESPPFTISTTYESSAVEWIMEPIVETRGLQHGTRD